MRSCPKLALELDACLHDGTLPRTLGMDQLWLDKMGSTRLLDFPLVSPATAPPQVADEVNRAWQLFREIIGRCRWNNETPGEVADYLSELETQTPTQKTFGNVYERLKEAVKSPFRLDWDRRLGLLAISMGTELVFFSTTSFLLAYAASYLIGNIYAAAAVAGLASIVFPGVVGHVFEGGLAFWVSGFQVRNVKTRKVARFRAGIRSLIAWLPLTITMALHVVFTVKENKVAYAFAAAPCLLLIGIGLIGVVCAIAQPNRGLQDHLVGTYVVHR